MRRLFLLALLATFLAGYEPFRSLKAPAEIIKQYEIVSPLITHQSEPQPHPRELTVHIVSQTTTFTLHLELNEGLLAPHFISTFYDENNREIIQEGQVNCFYHGRVLGHPEWTATMSTCHGLQGSFGDLSDKDHYYHLEPLNHLDGSLDQPHALYLGSELRYQEGTCGTSHHGNNTMLPPVLDRQAAKERLRRQSNNQPLIVEWVAVSDNRQFRDYNQNISATVLRALEVANFVDMLYRVLNIRVVLVNAITWTNGDQISIVSDSSLLLDNFQAYRPRITVAHDSAMLLTGIDLDRSTVGIAFTRTMCSDSNSVGVTQDGGASLDVVGSTAAHQLGHIFNMEHDSAPRFCSCVDQSGDCIMAASPGRPSPTQWSNCSRSDLQEGLTTYNLGRCLTNEPTMTVGDPICGNGIRERDEVCDCGSPEECQDPCCNATTCTLTRGAQCFTGPCCLNCQFVNYGTTCREATSECDIMEYCSGNFSECPEDVHQQDGSICNNSQSFCFSGFCRSRDDQCQTHFGSASAVEACYSDYNTQGTQSGNCGYTSTSFIPCASRNVLCGQLHCAGGNFMNNVGVRSTIMVITATTRSGEPCQSFTTRPGADIMSPGLVQDGSRCGDGMLCYLRNCTPVNQLSYIQACRSNNGQTCSGNGQCNNRNQCSCNVGFVGDACQTARGTVVDCGNLTNPANGQVSHTAGTTFEQTATYSCDTGFNLMGDTTRTCQATGVWSGNAPTCQDLMTVLLAVFLPACAACAALIVVAVVACVCKRRRRRRRKSVSIISRNGGERNSMDREETRADDRQYVKFIEMLPSRMIIPNSMLQLLGNIGQGEFGLVFKAHLKWHSTSETEMVAVKTMKGLVTPNDIHNLEEEVLKMQYFKHPNVMSLIGVCENVCGGPAVVMPFMANGSVLDYLRRERKSLVLDAEEEKSVISHVQSVLLGTCLQIAKGMEYLADQKIVHRDLAARNCMIDANGVIKVADFGLAEDVYTANYYRWKKGDTNMKFPVRWMSPEGTRDGIFTEKSDVWSFGVTSWEVFTGGTIPYGGIGPLVLLQLLCDGERLSKPSNSACTDEIYSLLLHCWDGQPEKRPTFRQLVVTIATMMEAVGGYLSLSVTDKIKLTSDTHLLYDNVDTAV